MPGEVNEHEKGFLNFLVEPNQRRILELLSRGPKRRQDVRELLDHKIQLNHLYSQAVVGHEHSPNSVINKLRALGAPRVCWIMSARSDLDGRAIALEGGIVSLFDSMSGGFVSCIPGNLGYFQYEAPSPGFLLVR